MKNLKSQASFDTKWEEIHAKQEWGGYPSEHVIRFTALNYYQAPDRSKVKILDFGCGAGANTWYFAREGFDTYAFDGSLSAVTHAKKNLARQSLKADIITADGLALPYEDGMFDTVVDAAVICTNTLADIRAMLDEIFHLLKKGGRIFSISFGKKTTGYGTGTGLEPDTERDVKEGRLQNIRIHWMTRESLQGLLSSAGFSNIVIDELVYTDRGSVVHQYLAQAQKL